MSANHKSMQQGTVVEIVAVNHERHSRMCGKRGVVQRFVKSRGIYQLDMADGKRWESYPQNVRAV